MKTRSRERMPLTAATALTGAKRPPLCEAVSVIVFGLSSNHDSPPV